MDHGAGSDKGNRLALTAAPMKMNSEWGTHSNLKRESQRLRNWVDVAHAVYVDEIHGQPPTPVPTYEPRFLAKHIQAVIEAEKARDNDLDWQIFESKQTPRINGWTSQMDSSDGENWLVGDSTENRPY